MLQGGAPHGLHGLGGGGLGAGGLSRDDERREAVHASGCGLGHHRRAGGGTGAETGRSHRGLDGRHTHRGGGHDGMNCAPDTHPPRQHIATVASPPDPPYVQPSRHGVRVSPVGGSEGLYFYRAVPLRRGSGAAWLGVDIGCTHAGAPPAQACDCAASGSSSTARILRTAASE